MAARLLIRAWGADAARDRGVVRALLGRLRGWLLAAGPPAATGLSVADLDGHQYFAAEQVPPVVELSLPAGTYHVAVHHGGRRSRYTVTLEQGALSGLDLRGAVRRR